MFRRLRKIAAGAAVLVALWWLSSAPVVGVLLGWCLLVYVIVRAAPAIRRDLSRILAGRFAPPADSSSSWRF